MSSTASVHTGEAAKAGLGEERAAKFHLASSTATMLPHVEFSELTLHSSLLVDEDDWSYSAPIEEDGCLPIPTRPGLGVTLDEKKVAAHALSIG